MLKNLILFIQFVYEYSKKLNCDNKNYISFCSMLFIVRKYFYL